MGTAIGDLVVKLGVDNQTFVSGLNQSGSSLDEFAGHTERAAEETEHFNGQIEGLRGGARGLNELGRGAQELSEKFGGANTAVGSTAKSMGGLVSGVGEAAMTYHALQESIELASGAQVFLNSISPLGWTVIAAGAIAAAAAYFHFTDGAEAAEEAAKKLAESQKEAGKEADSAIAQLQKEADALEKTSLQRFIAQLQQAGKSAADIATAVEKYQHLTDRIDAEKFQKSQREANDKITEELFKKQREMDAGPNAGDQLGPNADATQKAWANALQAQENERKQNEEQNRHDQTNREHALSQVHSLVEAAQSPLDKLIESEHALMTNFKNGLIDKGEYESGLRAIGEKAEADEKAKRKQQKEEPLGALEMNSAAAFEEIFKVLHPDEEPAKETADNTAKANELLAGIHAELSKKSVLEIR